MDWSQKLTQTLTSIPVAPIAALRLAYPMTHCVATPPRGLPVGSALGAMAVACLLALAPGTARAGDPAPADLTAIAAGEEVGPHRAADRPRGDVADPALSRAANRC